MYRNYVPPIEVIEPALPDPPAKPKKGKSIILYVVIILLLGFLTTSLGAVYLVLRNQGSKNSAQSSGLISTENYSEPSEQKKTVGENVNLNNSQETRPIDQNNINTVTSNPTNDKEVQKLNTDTEYTSIYSRTIGSANDAKIRADLSTIATTLLILMNEDGLPDNFPKVPKCIGTSTACFDLYKDIVPNFLDKPYFNPNGGTVENSKYFVGLAEDGVYSVVLQSTGADGNIIEVKK